MTDAGPRLPAELTFVAAEHDDAPSRPLMIVLPGGGYSMHADHEGVAIAEWLSSIGCNALIFRYPLAPARHPTAIVAARALLADLRSGRLALPADRTRIGVIGFSAGGHLAAQLSGATTAIERNASERSASEAVDDAGTTGGRPDLAILAYPVITMSAAPHLGSVEALLGRDSTPWERAEADADRAVDASTPATFLWHAADDASVQMTHSLSYARALSMQHVEVALHVFEHGGHGEGLAAGLGAVEQWTSLAEGWLHDHGW